MSANIETKKVELNLFVGVYFIYVFFIWICDAMDFCCYILNLEQNSLISRLLAIIIIVSVMYLLKNYFKFERKHRTKVYYLIIFLILVYSIIRSLIPDLSHDTCLSLFPNIFPGFNDRIDSNIFPFGLGTYTLTLNNHMFYLFYIILGYRMATMLNALSIILSYTIVIDIIELLTDEEYRKINYNNFILRLIKPFIRPEIFSFLAIFTYYISMNISMYMVDIIPGPFILELLRLVIKSYKDDKSSKSKCELLYFAAVAGLCLAMKMTNMMTTITLLIAYLYLNRKVLKINIFLIGTVMAVIPVCPYLLYAYLNTKNPVYPFFNAIFKSPYYLFENFKDQRWGPESLIQILYWPAKTMFSPAERLSELAPPFQYAVFLGLIAGIGLLIISIDLKKIIKGTYPLLALLYIVQVYFWVLTTGYARYALMQEIFAGILVYCFIIELLILYKSIWKYLGTVLMVVCLILQFGYGQLKINYSGYEWAWRPAVLKDPHSYVNNIKYVFHDIGLIGTREQRDKIDYILPIYPYSNLNLFLGSDNRMINIHYLYKYGLDKANPAYTQKVITKINDAEEKSKGIYCAVPNTLYVTIADEFNSAKQYIYDIEFAPSYFDPNYKILLIKTGLEKDNQNKLVYVKNDDVQFEFDKTQKKEIKFSGILAIAPYVTWDNPTTLFSIEASDGKTNKVVFQKEINILNFYEINENLNLDGLEGHIVLKYKHTFLDGSPTNWGYMTVLNPELQIQ